jgi:hypothetical protein
MTIHSNNEKGTNDKIVNIATIFSSPDLAVDRGECKVAVLTSTYTYYEKLMFWRIWAKK